MIICSHVEEKSLNNHTTVMFFRQSDIKQKKKPPAGMLATEVRTGDAPKPTFSTKSIESPECRLILSYRMLRGQKKELPFLWVPN